MKIFNDAVKKIHCIGMGGAGVSAIAECLLEAGYEVSGSNLSDSMIMNRLQNKGATVFVGHQAEHVNQVDLCIYSSAIRSDNPEWIACERQNITMMRRGEALAHIMHSKESIGIAGTHGKTTTTSLVTWIFSQVFPKISYAIGGEIHGFNHHASYQDGEYMVAELDESDTTFLLAHPQNVIVTNIDYDHLIAYEHSYNKLLESFAKFIDNIQRGGVAIVGADDIHVCALTKMSKKPCITYGYSEQVQWQIKNFEQFKNGITFDLVADHESRATFHAPLIGRHNALNATAAILMARHYGIEDEQIQHALNTFPGVDRRLNFHGDMSISNGKVSVYDDYGHHPKAIVATLEAMKEAFGHDRIMCVFQPHRYTRTQDCFDEFVEALRIPDQVFILPIYAASEDPIEGITSEALNERLAQTGQTTQFVHEKDLMATLHAQLKPGDVIIFQGAGDLVSLASDMVAAA
jgi:UDP-N-acetylmuramate--alanine ligase